MRKIIITKQNGEINNDADIRIIANTKLLGLLKKDENIFSANVSKSQQTVQAEMIDLDGKAYRSNAYFAVYGGKDIVLHLTVSGTNFKLTVK